MTGFFIYIIIGVSLYFLLEKGILENIEKNGIKDTNLGRVVNIILVALFWFPIIIYAIYNRGKQ